MIYFIVAFLCIGYRVFHASSVDFTAKTGYNKGSLDGELVFQYGIITVGLAITWPISLSLIAIYFVGKKYKKDL